MIDYKEKIFRSLSDKDFNEICLDVFHFQSTENETYRKYLSLIGLDPCSVNNVSKIPFLPIQFFKSHKVISSGLQEEIIFTSSSTTGMIPSKHYVADLKIYEESFITCFKEFYGDPKEYAILALLPSYLERTGSSLIYMTDKLMKLSENPSNGYYLYNHEDLYNKLTSLSHNKTKTILIGVSFALLDFVRDYNINFPNLTVIETGGMKGRGVELSREEIHNTLKKGFNIRYVHSEYGMAELLSQSYSSGEGIFTSPAWMKIVIRDLNNPFKLLPMSNRGGINIIDLANINSCSFIETQDIGIKEAENSFRILGRIKTSELRGCNLLLN